VACTLQQSQNPVSLELLPCSQRTHVRRTQIESLLCLVCWLLFKPRTLVVCGVVVRAAAAVYPGRLAPGWCSLPAVVRIAYAAPYADTMDYFRAVYASGETTQRVLDLTKAGRCSFTR